MTSPLKISADKTKEKAEKLVETNDEIASIVPVPVGYKILVVMPEVEEKSEGGIFFSDLQLERESGALMVGYVLKLGPDAYNDPKKFPGGPWCKEGDFVLFRAYSGTRFKIGKNELRTINDDTVEAVVDDPRGIQRV